MKGFLSGIILGTVVAGLGLVAASQLLPVVQMAQSTPEASAVAVPAGSVFNAERPDAPPILPGSEAAPESSMAPAVSEPDSTPENLPDTTPLATPDAAPLDETGLSAPEVPASPQIVGSMASPDTGTPDTELSMVNAPDIDTAPAGAEMADVPLAGDAPAMPESPGTDATSAPAPPEPVVTLDPTTDVPATPDAPDSPDNTVVVADAPPVAASEEPQGLRLPVPEIGDMAPGITTDRLPRIGSEPEAEEIAEPVVAAMQRNAIAFEPGSDAPRLVMVLLDVGDVRPDLEAFADFPVPLTVAIDPTAPDATTLMQAYRDAGLEVAILTPLPEGASPADVEVAFQSFINTLPQAVAVMDLPEAVLQDSRPRAAQVVEILAASGHGLITYDRGFNTALQIASQSGVPAGKVFRNIDAGVHDVEAMKRFLDQAAFRAGQEGTVILVAESRPETLAALAEWSLGTRAASVVFAPVSKGLMQ